MLFVALLVPPSFCWSGPPSPRGALALRLLPSHHHAALPTAVLLVLAPARPPAVPSRSAPHPLPSSRTTAVTDDIKTTSRRPTRPPSSRLVTAWIPRSLASPYPLLVPGPAASAPPPAPPPAHIALFPTYSIPRGRQLPTSDTHQIANPHPGCTLMLRHRPLDFDASPKPNIDVPGGFVAMDGL
ncbi:hypothetical protein B0H16DRAFT_1797899 [Mycena metata]|uniref:Uncharacterized protein n=1 Tax=Mycena metata TaxID=1033252 RepID=A0AAD7HEM0_9AGAR|nr:hypothetical protein B0H16DRAFT_1797899 [Mycena metata]